MTRPRTSGQLDAVCPVDWPHPLNTGLAGHWLCVPGWMGGSRWVNLARAGDKDGYHGTLTNMAIPPSSTSGWQGPVGRQGGYGSIGLDGSDDSVPTSLRNVGQSAGTIAWSQRPTAVYNSGTIRGMWGRSTGGANFGAQVYADNSWYVGWEVTAGQRVILTASATNWVQNEWNHYVFTWGATGSVLYHQGASIGSNGTAPTVNDIAADFTLGRYPYTGSLPLGGFVDDYRLYLGRALSAGQAYSLYDQSRQGHPDTLRWLPTRRWSLPPPASGDISGSLASTLGALTVAGTGTVAISGSLAITLDALTVTATGTAAISGSLASTLDALTVTATGAVAIAGSLAATLDALTCTATGTVAISGALAVTLGELTVTATGTVTDGPTGSLTATLGALTVTATGTVAIAGSLAVTLGALTVVASNTPDVSTPSRTLYARASHTPTRPARASHTPTRYGRASLMAIRQDFDPVFRAEAPTFKFTVGGAVDMSAWTAVRWCLLENEGDDPASALVTKTVGSGVAISGDDISVTTTSANFDREAGTYWYTLVRTTNNCMLAHGTIELHSPDAS